LILPSLEINQSLLIPPPNVQQGPRLWEEAVGTLRALGTDVEWRTYDIRHWHKVLDELDNIVAFLNEKVDVSMDANCCLQLIINNA
jgi:hypothetical protein